jgi:hypothetical protein
MKLLKLSLLALVLTALNAHAQSSADPAQAAFFARLGKLCGATFEGAATLTPNMPGDALAGKKLVFKFATCSADEIRIPFSVGEDRSRTLVVRHDAEGLSLKHDHRHADGTPETLTMYGGPAGKAGSALSQSFTSDAHTVKLAPATATNLWTLILSEDGKSVSYHLDRAGKPRYKLELQRVVAP